MQQAIERLKAVQACAQKSTAGLGHYEASMLLGKAYPGTPDGLSWVLFASLQLHADIERANACRRP